MRKTLALALLSAVSASCTHKVANGVSQRRPAAAPRAGMQATMQRQIENAVDAGDGDGAARMLRQQMAADPNNLAVRMELAEHYEKQGYGELALEHYRLAADRFPNEPGVVVAMARVLQAQKLPKEAIAVLERFVASHQGGFSDVHAWLGYLKDEIGEHQSAEVSHRAALAANASSAKLHNNLGYNLLLQAKNEEAAAEFRQALSIDPKMELARNNLGMAQVRTGGQWAQGSGDERAAHNNAAAALIEQGRYAEARKELDAALKIDRQYVPALKNLELLASLDGKPGVVPSGTPASGKTGGNEDSSTVVRSLKRFWFAIAGIEQQPAGPVTRRGGE